MTPLDITAARDLVALNDAAVDPTGTLTLYLGHAIDEIERLQCDYAKLAAACDIATPLLERQRVEIEATKADVARWTIRSCDQGVQIAKLYNGIRAALEIACGDDQDGCIEALKQLLPPDMRPDEESASD